MVKYTKNSVFGKMYNRVVTEVGEIRVFSPGFFSSLHVKKIHKLARGATFLFTTTKNKLASFISEFISESATFDSIYLNF